MAREMVNLGIVRSEADIDFNPHVDTQRFSILNERQTRQKNILVKTLYFEQSILLLLVWARTEIVSIPEIQIII